MKLSYIRPTFEHALGMPTSFIDAIDARDWAMAAYVLEHQCDNVGAISLGNNLMYLSNEVVDGRDAWVNVVRLARQHKDADQIPNAYIALCLRYCAVNKNGELLGAFLEYPQVARMSKDHWTLVQDVFAHNNGDAKMFEIIIAARVNLALKADALLTPVPAPAV